MDYLIADNVLACTYSVHGGYDVGRDLVPDIKTLEDLTIGYWIMDIWWN